MSHIDQAFIQAYSTDENYPPVEETLSLPKAPPAYVEGAMPAPHIQLYSTVQDAPPVGAPHSGAEPIPAPHFRGQDFSELQAETQADTHADIAKMQQAMFEPTAKLPPVAETTQRRPLSAFVEPETAPSNAFEPVFEVDAFRWPAVTDDLLLGHSDLLVPVVEQLLAASEAGRSLIGIAGASPGVGCSTVQMCLARLLVSAGKSVALVDSNFSSAHLAKDLGLEFDVGWQDVLSGKIPLAESVVRSIEDRMVLLPLSDGIESPVELLAGIQTSVVAGVLRYHYDVVLFDLGAAGREQQYQVAEQIVEQCRLDASIIVADTALESTETDQEIDTLMSVLGTSCLGVIGNFAVGHSG